MSTTVSYEEALRTKQARRRSVIATGVLGLGAIALGGSGLRYMSILGENEDALSAARADLEQAKVDVESKGVALEEKHAQVLADAGGADAERLDSDRESFAALIHDPTLRSGLAVSDAAAIGLDDFVNSMNGVEYDILATTLTAITDADEYRYISITETVAKEEKSLILWETNPEGVLSAFTLAPAVSYTKA